MSDRKLLKAKVWTDKYFAKGSGPAYNTIREWVIEGHLEGELVGPGQQAYIYEDVRPGVHSKAKNIALQLAMGN